jgi:hypothetical protein
MRPLPKIDERLQELWAQDHDQPLSVDAANMIAVELVGTLDFLIAIRVRAIHRSSASSLDVTRNKRDAEALS